MKLIGKIRLIIDVLVSEIVAVENICGPILRVWIKWKFSIIYTSTAPSKLLLRRNNSFSQSIVYNLNSASDALSINFRHSFCWSGNIGSDFGIVIVQPLILYNP